MKLRLSLLSRKSRSISLAALLIGALFGGICMANPALSLGTGDFLSVDYADLDGIESLNGGKLQLRGGSVLQLANCGEGDGRTYILYTGVSGMVDAQGNELILSLSNNSISTYFDTSQPGSGFWAGSTLFLDNSGALQIVRYSEVPEQDGYASTISVNEVADITICQDSAEDIIFEINVTQLENERLVVDGKEMPVSFSFEGSRHFTSESVEQLASLTFSNFTSRVVDISAGERLGYSHLKNLCFEGNVSGENGSVIQTKTSNSVIFSDIGALSFAGNGITTENARGGAISGFDDGKSSVTIVNCGSASFEHNFAQGISSDNYFALARGGAIAIRDTNILNIKDSSSVKFTNNAATSDMSITYQEGHASGGAISIDDNAGAFVNNNAVVLFQQNKSDVKAEGSAGSRGGAIAAEINSTLEMNGNSLVSFIQNTASATGAAAVSHGGAISSDGGDSAMFTSSSISVSSNSNVIFSGNQAQSHSSSFESETHGGAIYAINSNLALNDNGSLIFNENAALSEGGTSKGGAIYNGANLYIKGNDIVTFSGNVASSESRGCVSNGGAICSDCEVRLINNGTVEFIGNKISARSDSLDPMAVSVAYGGAINCDTSSLFINDNEKLLFSGNSAYAKDNTDAYASGGAIQINGGDLSIRNNGSVLFEKNVEHSVTDSGESILLRSISAWGINESAPGSKSNVSFSVDSGKIIEFRDTIFLDDIEELSINSDYNSRKQNGDVIFSGAYTEDHLNDILTTLGAARRATSEEIRKSQTSEVYAMTNLYGGRLRVEDGAIYQGFGITVYEESGATVLVKDAMLSHCGYDLTFNAETTLQIEGSSQMEGNLVMLSGSILRLDSTVNLDGALTLGYGVTLGGNLLTDILNMNAGDTLTLARGVDLVKLQTQDVIQGLEYASLMSGEMVKAAEYFANFKDHSGYALCFDSNTQTLNISCVMPEPATTTLSMLALTVLVTRRRREI